LLFLKRANARTQHRSAQLFSDRADQSKRECEDVGRTPFGALTSVSFSFPACRGHNDDDHAPDDGHGNDNAVAA
jgi:hypothetical protein